MEKKAVNDMFVVLSDIWLDDEEVVDNLHSSIHILFSLLNKD